MAARRPRARPYPAIVVSIMDLHSSTGKPLTARSPTQRISSSLEFVQFSKSALGKDSREHERDLHTVWHECLGTTQTLEFITIEGAPAKVQS
jgi:hypothetical protein